MCDVKCISNGIVAGVIAGIVFAFILLLGGMTEAIGSIIGMPSKITGMFIHFIASIVAGVVFAAALGWLVRSWGSAIVIGLLFGIVIWILGPMTLLPTLSGGEPLFAKWSSAGFHANIHPLIGHLAYGLILGLAYCFLKKGKLHKLKKPKH